MAERIKGIVVEIGGDTTGLDKALKGVNKESADLQSELKRVDRLLKLDPTNTELLEQKQKLLSKAINNTSGKLDTLKTAEKQAQEQFKEGKISEEQYRALQREIVSTEQNLKSLEKQAKETGNKFGFLTGSNEKYNSAINKLSVGVVGVGAGLVGMAVNAGKAADDINTLSKQTGLSTEQIQKFQYASDIIDVSMDTLTGSMAKLTKNMATAKKGTGDTAAAFSTLGISITDIDGNLRNNHDVFNETIKALGKVENETERDALAMQIFGKSAQDLNPLILGGADALNELGKQAEDAGLILSQDALDGANAFNDCLDTLKAQGSAAIAKVGGEIAEKLLPNMDKIVGMASKIISFVLEHSKVIGILIGVIGGLILALKGILIVSNVINLFKEWEIIQKATTAAQWLLNAAMNANPIAIIITLITALVAATIYLWNTNEDFRNALIEIWSSITSIFQTFDEWLTGIFTTDWTQNFGVLGNILNGFFQNVSNIWESVKAIFTGVIDFITAVFTGQWGDAWTAVVNIFKGIFDLVVDIAKAPLNAVIAMLNAAIDGINLLIKGLNKISFDIPEWVPGLGGESFGINIPMIGKIPFLAKGGILSRGSAVVGEAGPELLSMINGRAVVQPLSSGGFSKSAGVTVNMHNTFNGYKHSDGVAASRDLVKTIDRALGRYFA